eukprot:3723622-Prymnesium_polylepis.1
MLALVVPWCRAAVERGPQPPSRAHTAELCVLARSCARACCVRLGSWECRSTPVPAVRCPMSVCRVQCVRVPRFCSKLHSMYSSGYGHHARSRSRARRVSTEHSPIQLRTPQGSHPCQGAERCWHLGLSWSVACPPFPLRLSLCRVLRTPRKQLLF